MILEPALTRHVMSPSRSFLPEQETLKRRPGEMGLREELCVGQLVILFQSFVGIMNYCKRH